MDEERKRDFLRLLKVRNETILQWKTDSPYSKMSADFFCRFHRDPALPCLQDETEVTAQWRVAYKDTHPVMKRMAQHLREFLGRCMDVKLEAVPFIAFQDDLPPAIVLTDSAGGSPESFSIIVSRERILVSGADAAGVRNGVVRLIGLFGLRMAPCLAVSSVKYTPRNEMRMVYLDSVQYDVFLGGNAAMLGNAELYALSDSEAIAELTGRRDPAALAELIRKAETADAYALKKYANLATIWKFKPDDGIFAKHPDIRGSLTFSKDGDYTLCTQSPLVRQYLTESIEGLFRNIPGLDGVILIVGGEGFYHCFTRPYGVAKGHTNCPRCEALGAKYVVSDLCNVLAEAARKVNPEAEVIAWPYSAAACWSGDRDQLALIRMFRPGVSVMTEPEKDEVLYKPGGVRKRMWDYSIDMTELGQRAEAQLGAQAPVHILTMAEMSFEASLLPMVPVHERWARRAEALAASGARGIYLFNITPFNGLSSAEIYQYKWFSPPMADDELLGKLARRIAGSERAGRLLRQAWHEASGGFDYVPFINVYFKGPQYLGPAHPLVLDAEEEIPAVFSGYHAYRIESNLDAVIDNPVISYDLAADTHADCPGEEGVPILETYYRVAQACLERAVLAVDEAQKLVPEECAFVFDMETLPIRWFCHTIRTCGNLYELNRILHELKKAADAADADRLFSRLGGILLDEKQNTLQALPIALKDTRLEVQRGDYSVHSLADMMRAKLALLDRQIGVRLPALRKSIVRQMGGDAACP